MCVYNPSVYHTSKGRWSKAKDGDLQVRGVWMRYQQWILGLRWAHKVPKEGKVKLPLSLFPFDPNQ